MSIGIKFIAPIYDSSGLAQVAREAALALYDSGIDVSITNIKNFSPGLVDIKDDMKLKLQKMEGNKLSKYVAIHMYPVDRLTTIDNEAKANIVWNLYETDRIPYVWGLILNNPLINEVFVPTEFNKNTFIKSGVGKDKISVVPFGVDSSKYNPNNEVSNDFQKEKEAFYFGSVFTFKICKGYDALLAAFFDEFKNEPSAKLVLKADMNMGKDDKEKRSVAINLIKSYKGNSKAEVLYISNNLSEENMTKLYRSLDCFVLPSRGEGWGLGILQAMSSGVVPITTKCSAQMSYCNSENSLMVDAPLVKINSVEWLMTAPHQQEHHWWEPNYQQLKAQMRFAFENRDKLKEMGKNARLTAEKLDWKNSVVKMLPIIQKYS